MFESTLEALRLATLLTAGVCEDEVVLRCIHTSTSETWALGVLVGSARDVGTDDFMGPDVMVQLVGDASRLVERPTRILPPVDHEAEARIDAIMAEKYQREPRTRILRRG